MLKLNRRILMVFPPPYPTQLSGGKNFLPGEVNFVGLGVDASEDGVWHKVVIQLNSN